MDESISRSRWERGHEHSRQGRGDHGREQRNWTSHSSALASKGAIVVLGARRIERLESTISKIVDAGGQGAAIAIDVTAPADVRALVDLAVGRFGRLDVLVSNAGISRIGPLSDLDAEGWSDMIDVNVRGALNGIAAALPVFTNQASGQFVTTVSVSGLKITPNQAVYAATKNAVRTVMESLRQESTDGRLRTTSISPGYVRTKLIDSGVKDPALRAQMQQNMSGFGIDPLAVARAIGFAIAQPDDVEISDLTIRPSRQG